MRPALSLGAILGAGLATLSGFVWSGCRGDDPEGAPVTSDGGVLGEYGGKCFADGKCKQGLVCAQGLVCLNPGEERDGEAASPGDSGPVDARVQPDAPARGDASGAACSVLETNTLEMVCPNGSGTLDRCAAGSVCCPGTGCLPSAAGCTSSFHYGCLGGTCSGATSRCCATGSVIDGGLGGPACGRNATIEPLESFANCADACRAQIELCSPGFSCPGGKVCVQGVVSADGVPFVVGVCL